MNNPNSIFVALLISFILSFDSFTQNTLVGAWKLEEDYGIANFTFSESGHAIVQIESTILGGDNYTLADIPVALKYQTNTAVQPNQIDLVIVMIENNLPISKMLGIFELDNDRLKIAIDFFEGPRPTSFDEKTGMVLIRANKN